jgi:hypothetical protein
MNDALASGGATRAWEGQREPEVCDGALKGEWQMADGGWQIGGWPDWPEARRYRASRGLTLLLGRDAIRGGFCFETLLPLDGISCFHWSFGWRVDGAYPRSIARGRFRAQGAGQPGITL